MKFFVSRSVHSIKNTNEIILKLNNRDGLSTLEKVNRLCPT